jgi:transposase, IS30 family
MGVHLTPDQRRRIRELRKKGATVEEVARQVGCTLRSVMRVANNPPSLPDRLHSWSPGPSRLSVAEREDISLGLGRGESFVAIARQLGRSTSTVSREVAANGGRRHYRAWRAQKRAFCQARRPKVSKLAACPRLADQVREWLGELWSPEEIAIRLPLAFPDDPMMRVSHETIYQSIYVQGRGELRRELARCLRSGRAKRRPQGRIEKRGRIRDMVLISERPAEVADRAVPGHWEGDLILGEGRHSAVGTLVERTTGYVLLLHLPDGRSAEEVDRAMRRAIQKLPGLFFRTITWDQGKEMAKHAAFTLDTGIQVYFCDPASPWQRGSNENTNGLLRQYMPKATSLAGFSEPDLDVIARSLNGRPRKRHGGLTPSEKLAEILAMTG